MITFYQNYVNKLPLFDGIPALLIRLYLAPVFIIAGYSKLQLGNPDVTGVARLAADPNIVAWFGNAEWGLGLPFPTLLANLAAWTEFLGGWLLLVGLFTRLVSLPLMFTMLVAATTVHLQNGWFAITPTNPDTSPAKVLSWLGVDGAPASIENSIAAGRRLEVMRDILAENGNTDWLYETGNIAVLNNGVEFSVTYFIMLLALLFIGAGRFTSVDHLLAKKFLVARDTNPANRSTSQ
ncbi:DoxX family protein [Thalassotalea sp. LPB0316]|uniref:HvfX family Cu-binding RiPP maturation protein n=1 Tax=Thalassotalea sp. LPB0316 TaxID=2769490 RepID=UPI001867D7D2|nr:DoxX family protein [Thalassotalea sp. LPB0316]QOL24840.1 DoxX family protein [Thalassotalea sp. LPB0316]